MNKHLENDARDALKLAEKAAAWLSAVRHGGDEQRAAFAAWLTASPRHVEEVLMATAVERALAGVDRERRMDVDAILAGHGTNILPLENLAQTAGAPLPATKRRRRWQWTTGLAAMFTLLAFAWNWRPAALGGWERYATAIGEQRTIELDDGSLMQLNTHSQARVKLDAQERHIELIEGEALFKVERDPRRPFRVHANSTVIQALGTQFNVYRRQRDTTVSVLEGAVQVNDPGKPSLKLTAGEITRVAPDQTMKKKTVADKSRLAAWRQRRLVFEADTLEDIAAEFNRYNRSPKVRIDGDGIGQLRFTGAFDADDPLSLGELLGKDRELRFEQRGDELIIRPR